MLTNNTNCHLKSSQKFILAFHWHFAGKHYPKERVLGASKHRAISRQEKMAFSTPAGLPWDSPPPPPESVRTYVRAYADVTTKISRIDGLPNFLIHGASRRA